MSEYHIDERALDGTPWEMVEKWEVGVKCEHPSAYRKMRPAHIDEGIERWNLGYGEYEVVRDIDGSLTEEQAIRRAFEILADEYMEKFGGTNQ